MCHSKHHNTAYMSFNFENKAWCYKFTFLSAKRLYINCSRWVTSWRRLWKWLSIYKSNSLSYHILRSHHILVPLICINLNFVLLLDTLLLGLCSEIVIPWKWITFVCSVTAKHHVWTPREREGVFHYTFPWLSTICYISVSTKTHSVCLSLSAG